MRSSTTTIILRSLLGLLFFVFGLNGFLRFMPTPPLPEPAQKFAGALAASGYMFQLTSGTQVVAGAMLLLGVAVPLALTLLAPIIVNILFFHVFLSPAPSAIMPGLIAAIIEAILAWQYRAAFAPLFRSSPGSD